MNIPEGNRTWNFGGADDIAKLVNALPIGLAISAPDVLFTKIEDSDIEGWAERFGGA